MKRFMFVLLVMVFICSLCCADSKPPYLVFLPLGEGITPAKALKDADYITSLPIDGIVMSAAKVGGGIWTNKESIKYSDVYDEVAPLKGKFPKLSRSWLMSVTTLDVGNWFDDWSVCIRNFATVARACKDLGMEGVLFDNSNDEWHADPNWEYKAESANKTREQYAQQVYLRGFQIMQACVKEYPEFKMAAIRGPADSEKGDPIIFGSPAYDLLSAFYSGLVAGAGDKGMVVDVSVFYNAVENKVFEESYQFRKYTLPSTNYDKSRTLKEEKADWQKRYKVGYGLCYGYTEEGMTNALMQCDYMSWYYNGADNLDPETLKQDWFPKDRFPSLAAARTAATAPGVNNIASGIHFNNTLGEETIKITTADTKFSYTLDFVNNTGAPVKINYLQKPSWIKAKSNNTVISGVPSVKPRVDTILVMISADGKSDILKIRIETAEVRNLVK